MTANKIADIRLFEQEGARRALSHYMGTIYRSDIEHIDLKNSITRRRTFLELNSYEDVYFVASSLAVKDGTIEPKTSQTANWHNRSYVTPIKIDIDELPIVKRTRIG